MEQIKKKFLLAMICVCSSFSIVQAQSTDIELQSSWKTSAGWEFAPVGAKWCYFERDIRSTVGDGFIFMECVKDTLLGDLPMRKITRNRVDIYRDGADPTFTYMDCFYVHCKGDSAYIHNPETGGLDLLYVFNAQPGDTLALVVPYYARYAPPGEAFRISIEDVTVKDMGGVPVNAYRYKGLDGINYDFYTSQYFDYVGSSTLFFPISVLPTAGDHFLLSYFDPIVGRLQFEDKEREIWDFPWDVYPWDIEDWLMGEDDNYPWGVGEVPGQPGAEVRVAYSPEERRLTVERPGQGADGCRTVLFTDRGVQALEFTGTEADLSSLPAGIYLVQVRDGKGGAVLHAGKIQVQ